MTGTGTKHGDIGNKALDWTWDDRNGNGITDDDTGVNVDINGDDLCIGGGVNNVVDSALSGDDTLDPNCECDPATPCPCIRNGPDGQCESTASGDDLPGTSSPGMMTGRTSITGTPPGREAVLDLMFITRSPLNRPG